MVESFNIHIKQIITNLMVSFAIRALCYVHLLLVITLDEFRVVVWIGVVYFVVLYGGCSAWVCDN